MNWFKRDKALHFIGGSIIASAVILATGYVLGAFLAAAVIGVAKEIYDLNNTDSHTPEVWDAIATAAGGALVAITVAGGA